MFYAYDSEHNKIEINEADPDKEYFCLSCGQPLIQKRRNVGRAMHFAHFGDKKGVRNCSDKWHYDMSNWHKDWQNKFPKRHREVVIENSGKRHRADVCIGNVVIEFQHSRISYEEFQERNVFYINAGKSVVWLFDLSEKWEQKQITENKYKDNCYNWKNVAEPFKKIEKIQEKQISLYFQICNKSSYKYPILEVSHSYKYFRLFYKRGKQLSANDFYERMLLYNNENCDKSRTDSFETNKQGNVHGSSDFDSSLIEKFENGEKILDLYHSHKLNAENKEMFVKCLPIGKTYKLVCLDGVGAEFEFYEYDPFTDRLGDYDCKSEIIAFFNNYERKYNQAAAWKQFNKNDF